MGSLFRCSRLTSEPSRLRCRRRDLNKRDGFEPRPATSERSRHAKGARGREMDSEPASKNELPTIIQPQKIIDAQATSHDRARDFTAASPARETEVLASPAPRALYRRSLTQIAADEAGGWRCVALVVVGIIMAALTKLNTTTLT